MGKSQKNYMSIKSKLMAAVAMLLVASFMVVSSTYAWFTLSTAPEVTGIKTTIGANGSLEIALLDTTDGSTTLTTITSGVGDGSAAKQLVEKNKTWGNLVDLSADDYGLKTISLLPSRLNVMDGNILNPIPLLTPVYGADGRVDSLEGNTVTGTFDGTVFKTDSYKGVRVLGTASGMTAQQLGFRSALATMTTELKSANKNANSSLTVCGPELASIAASHVMAGNAADDPGPYDITKFSEMFTALDNALIDVSDMIKAFIGTELAVKMKDDLENTYKLANTALAAADLDTLITTGTVTYEGGTVTVTIPSELKDLYDVYYKDAKDALDTAKTTYENLTVDKDKVAWSDVEDVLIESGLLKMNDIKISGYPLSEVKANLGTIAASGAVVVQLPEGSGIHANIAKLTGENLSASIDINLADSPIGPINGMHASMVTTIEQFLDIPVKSADAAAPSAADSTQPKNITDTFGYVLDFAFRTNAPSSDLLLQTAGVNRIYSQGGVAETQGSGSTMTFSSLSLEPTEVATLMKAIRLVFVDGTNNIVAIGAVEGANTTTPTVAVDGTNVTGDIYLYEFSFENGILTLGDMHEDESKLIALSKNTPTQLSVYVYLDGDLVENSMVAANTKDSMSGSINLQFSSSAELVPMEYTPFMNQTATETTAATTTAAETTTP